MIANLLFVLTLAVIHIFANKISVLHTLSRCKWLSLAGGISVAFVFVHILPELHRMQDSLESNGKPEILVENYLYVMALAGVLLFYGLEQAVIHFQKKNASDKDMAIEDDIFWWHIALFATFNILIGYYFHHELEVKGTSSFLTFTALGFHFLINDYSLLQHHENMYHDTGRWIMAGAVVVGWGIGTIYTTPEIISSALFALLAGAIIVNSFKEELPEDKESNFGFFLIGATIYSVLLLV
jgi:hypothetical protein